MSFLSLVIMFLISIISLKALHITFIIPTFLSRCMVMTLLHPVSLLPEERKKAKEKTIKPTTPNRLNIHVFLILSCKDKELCCGARESHSGCGFVGSFVPWLPERDKEEFQ